jgi:elongation factor G
MMAVEVTTPEDFIGEVIGDLNSRRGQIQAMDERMPVPASSRLSFRCRRCSATSEICGPRPRAARAYSMQFDSYNQVPNNVAEEIIAKARGE